MSKNHFAQIESPEALRKIPTASLPLFASELRQEIIHVLAKGEGQLGSSLGTVELTIA